MYTVKNRVVKILFLLAVSICFNSLSQEKRLALVIGNSNYTKGFLKSVQSKLSNERFVAGAPEAVITNERKKESDALAKIALLEEKMASLN